MSASATRQAAGEPGAASFRFLLSHRRRSQGYREALAGQGSDAANAPSLTMLWIPPGRFWMGSPAEEAERRDSEGPRHLVQLQGFFISQTPITQAQWRAVAELDEQGLWRHELKPNPSFFHPDHWQGQNGEIKARLGHLLAGETTTDDRPVECVSWHEALEFCHRLGRLTGRGYTLPSEAQWEYACLAGTAKPYAFGESINAGLANYRSSSTPRSDFSGEYVQQTTPVKMFPANAWGLHDSHANVWEWCFDHWHHNYVGAPDDCRPWLEKDDRELLRERIMRGGSWNSEAVECRAACRSSSAPHVTDWTIGFRVVCLPYLSPSVATRQTGSFFESDRISPGIPIHELKLSKATRQSFIAADVKTVDDLMGFSYEDLLGVPGIGVRGADEVIEALEALGITLPQQRTSERF
ncbi:MAG: SUMF1/EgtB/PvdO family nonheme iron enzyme [Cyanobium sp.]|jgi:formylglycine-generating enzyme required for sulfatase activity